MKIFPTHFGKCQNFNSNLKIQLYLLIICIISYLFYQKPIDYCSLKKKNDFCLIICLQFQLYLITSKFNLK